MKKNQPAPAPRMATKPTTAMISFSLPFLAGTPSAPSAPSAVSFSAIAPPDPSGCEHGCHRPGSLKPPQRETKAAGAHAPSQCNATVTMVNGTFPGAAQLGKNCRANMVNKTFLPPAGPCQKYLTPSKTIHFRVGTAFAEYFHEPAGLGELKGLRDPDSGLGEQAQGSIKRGDYRWRIRFSSDYHGR